MMECLTDEIYEKGLSVIKEVRTLCKHSYTGPIFLHLQGKGKLV